MALQVLKRCSWKQEDRPEWCGNRRICGMSSSSRGQYRVIFTEAGPVLLLTNNISRSPQIFCLVFFEMGTRVLFLF